MFITEGGLLLPEWPGQQLPAGTSRGAAWVVPGFAISMVKGVRRDPQGVYPSAPLPRALPAAVM